MAFDPTLVPISNKNGTAMRTPVDVMIHEGPEGRTFSIYTLAVGTQTYRYLKEDHVPEEIKSLIGMVKAFPPEVRVNRSTGVGRMVPPDPRLEDIGWEIPKDYSYQQWEGYILIVSNETFEAIRGGHT